MAATGTQTPNIGLRCPVGTDPASVDDINYNSGVIDTKLGAVGSTSVQAQIDALNSKINPSGSKYIRGRIDVSTGSTTTVLGKIQTFITGVVTGGNYVWFDVMLSYQGTHYFSGHLYPDKDYGDGIYIGVDGTAYKWTRLNNVDSVEEFATKPAYSTIERNIKVSNCAGTVTISFEYYTASTEQTLANTTFATVPVGYRPSFKVSFVEPFGNRRIFVNEDGTIFSTTDIPANANVRGYITYVC